MGDLENVILTQEKEDDEEETLNENIEDSNDVSREIKEYKCHHVNMSILPSKMAFFCETARRIGFSPNLALFLTSIGLNKAEAGFVVGFRLIGMLFGGPFWGMIADKWHCHRTVITIMAASSALFMCSQPFLSMHYGNKELNTCPSITVMDHSNNLMKQNCTLYGSNCTFNSNQTDANNQSILPSTVNSPYKRFGALFTVMFIVNILICFTEGSAIAFVDTATIRRSQLSRHRKVHYGRQRMFASMGGACGVVATNLAIDYFPTSNITCYTGIVIMYTIFTLAFVCVTLYLYKGLSFKDDKNGMELQEEEENIKKKKRAELRKILFSTLKRSDVAFFYLTTLVSGLLYSQYTSFLYIYLKELNASTTLLSLSIVASSLASVIGFAFSHKIVKLLRGTWNAIVLSFVVYFVRYLGRSQIVNPWIILLLQPMHAISATLFVSVSLNHLKETSPLPIITTLVSLFNVTHYGLGTIIGTSICGVVYEKFGGRILFLGTGILAVVWAFVVVLYIVFKKPSTRKQTESINMELAEALKL